MKVAIFYFSLKKGTDRQRIIIDGSTWGYVRVEVLEGADVTTALDKADPQPDEAVMNSHEVSA